MATKTELDTIELWQHRFEEFWPIKQYYSPIWDECIDWYMGNMRTDLPPGAEWMNANMLADPYLFVESVFPQWILDILNRPRHFRVEAPTAKGEFYQTGVRAWLEQSLRKQNYVSRFIPAARMGYIQGHITQKTTWMQMLGEQLVPDFGPTLQDANGEIIQQPILGTNTVNKITYNGAYTEWPDNHRIWKSLQFDRMGRRLWWAEDIVMNMDWMFEMNKQVRQTTGQNLYSNLNQLKTVVSTRATSDYNGLNRMQTNRMPLGMPHGYSVDENRSTVERLTGIAESEWHGHGAIKMKQCWGWIPESVKKYDDTQWRMQLIAEVGEGIMLRDIACPTHDHRPPYRDVPIQQVGEEPFGRSPLQWVGPEVENRSQFRNVRLAQEYINLLPPKVARRDADWDENEFLLMPGGIWFYDGDMSPRDAIMEMPRSGHNPGAYMEDSLMAEHNKAVFGMSDAMSSRGLGSRATAFEVNVVNQLGSAKARLIAYTLSEDSEKGALADTFNLGRVFLTDPEWVALANEQGRPFQITADQLEYPIDIFMEPDTSLDPQAVQNLANLVPAFGAIPEAAIKIKWGAVAKEALSRIGIHNAEKLERTDEEVAEIQRQQQEAEFVRTLLGQNAQSSRGTP